MSQAPLVSVICLCFNQKNYVAEAIQSVWDQTYEHIELIVVDDGSSDGSKDEIRKVLENSEVKFIDLDENTGNCAAFNKGYRASAGEYIIDLAADDVLLPHRVEIGIRDFDSQHNAGVHFADAFLVNQKNQSLGTHYERDPHGNLIDEIPKGNVYIDLISKYFISPPTMMFRREVIDELDGYDENLAYEDFDFWIRSSRTYEYIFNPAPLVRKRILKKSHSTAQFAFRSKYLRSTYLVCEKILELNKTHEEHQALQKRCRYEIRQCLKTFNFELIPKYQRLIKQSRLAT